METAESAGGWRQNLSPSIAELTARLGRSPNATELAGYLHADRDEVIEKLIRTGIPTVEFDENYCSGIGLDNPETIDTIDEAERQLAKTINIGGFDSLLDLLSLEERSVVVLRLSKSQTQSEIAARLRLSPTAVTRILGRSLRVLREHA